MTLAMQRPHDVYAEDRESTPSGTKRAYPCQPTNAFRPRHNHPLPVIAPFTKSEIPRISRNPHALTAERIAQNRGTTNDYQAFPSLRQTSPAEELSRPLPRHTSLI